MKKNKESAPKIKKSDRPDSLNKHDSLYVGAMGSGKSNAYFDNVMAEFEALVDKMIADDKNKNQGSDVK